MQEEKQTENEISLSDIFRALLGKIWILIVTLVAGVIVGMSFGYVKYHSVHYYGTTVKYFVSSSGANKTDTGVQNTPYGTNVLPTIADLLTNERFMRQLMVGLEEADGLYTSQDEEGKYTFVSDLPAAEQDKELLAKYQALLLRLKSSLSYSYNIDTNMITVTVSALNAPDFASRLLDQVHKYIPEYILANMPESTFGTTSCEQQDYKQSGLMNAGQTKREMLKFGLLLGLAAFVVACVVVIIVDRTDTRLRDYDDLSRRLNIPVLGVIPRIEESDEINKKTAAEATK